MSKLTDNTTGCILPLTFTGKLSRKAIGRRVILYYGAPAQIIDVRGGCISFMTRDGKVTGNLAHIMGIEPEERAKVPT